MDIRFQLADVAVALSLPPVVARCFAPYLGQADHATPPRCVLDVAVVERDGCFILPSGRREISPEIAAAALWLEVQPKVQGLLPDWLQLSGLAIDGSGRRLLVIGEDALMLRLLAVEAMAAGLDVSSAAGIGVKDGMSLPHALPLHVMARDLRRLDPTGRGFPVLPGFHDEMGEFRCIVTPQSFGRPWRIGPLPVGAILALDWNEGGQTRIGTAGHRWRLERILDAVHIPAEFDIVRRMALMGRARQMAGTIPLRRLHAGRLDSVPELLACQLREAGHTPP